MSNKLIRKAYEDHQGVWPYSDHDLVVTSTKLNPNFDEGVYYFASANANREVDLMTNGEAWQWVGTKADFDAYGESLKEKWTPEVGQECEYKYKKYEAEFKSGVAKFIGNKLIVIDTKHGSYEQCYHIEALDFRPLKTESENQASAMFDIVKDATDLYHACELLVKEGYIK